MNMKVELIRIQNVFKHLQEDLSHGFQWSVNNFKWKILEAYLIKIMVPSLNSQMNNDLLTLFGNGITRPQMYCK